MQGPTRALAPALTPHPQASPGYDGKSKNFAQRRAARAGLDLATMVEPMFMALDLDHSGACMACAWHVHSPRLQLLPDERRRSLSCSSYTSYGSTHLRQDHLF